MHSSPKIDLSFFNETLESEQKNESEPDYQAQIEFILLTFNFMDWEEQGRGNQLLSNLYSKSKASDLKAQIITAMIPGPDYEKIIFIVKSRSEYNQFRVMIILDRFYLHHVKTNLELILVFLNEQCCPIRELESSSEGQEKNRPEWKLSYQGLIALLLPPCDASSLQERLWDYEFKQSLELSLDNISGNFRANLIIKDTKLCFSYYFHNEFASGELLTRARIYAAQESEKLSTSLPEFM
ncbi:MAG: hypothetical protein H0U70_03415 [Tatlockia sp.]|nr:hypothetical protein [Tatlockia sp.]